MPISIFRKSESQLTGHLTHSASLLLLTGLLFANTYVCWAQAAKKPMPTKATSTKIQTITTDLCVYGGVSAGVIGAYTATKYGKKAVLIEPSAHLGGMSASGLGATDIGNKYAITGLAKDFYRRMGFHYGKLEQWLFEPHVAERIFEEYVQRAGFPIYKQHRIVKVNKQGTKIVSIDLERSDKPGPIALRIQAKQFMDCTYEGDLMALAGVSYHVGREDNKEFNETLNGVQLQDKHQFPDGIDPYKVEGDPKSGLLWGISPEPVEPNGTGDKKVQAYNYRICLSYDSLNRIPFSAPAGYDASKYALLGRLIEKGKWKTVNNYMIINKVPGNKTDINHKGGFSLDFIGNNWDYPEANYKRREEIAKAHENYIKGLFYFLANDPSLPSETRTSMRQYGYPKDEFKDNGGFPHQMYVREARRMRGMLVMTQHHCQGREVVEDGVGMAAYQMDSHNCQRVVKDGMVKNEGNVEVDLGSKPYPIAYRAILPQPAQTTNLTVPVCMSATHIAYGSIRMEPVFMVLAQSAAVAACRAIDAKIPLHLVDVKQLQQELANNPLADGTAPDVLMDNETAFKTLNKSFKQLDDMNDKFGNTLALCDSAASDTAFANLSATVSRPGKYRAYVYLPEVKKGKRNLTTARMEISMIRGNNFLGIKRLEANSATKHEWLDMGSITVSEATEVKFVFKKQGPGYMAVDAAVLIPEEHFTSMKKQVK